MGKASRKKWTSKRIQNAVVGRLIRSAVAKYESSSVTTEAEAARLTAERGYEHKVGDAYTVYRSSQFAARHEGETP